MTGIDGGVTGDVLAGLAGRTFGGVIFDMDGTLVDSTPAVLRSWITWAEELGIDPLRLEGNHGVPAADIAAQFVAPADLDRSLQRITELEINDVADIVVLPGAAEALEALADAPNAIATSCTRPLADARIGAADLRAPDVVVTVDDVERGKPDPEPFLLAAARLGIAPEDCLVVEDAPLGLRAAHAAGCASLAVVTTSSTEDLASADAVVDNLSAVRFEVAGGRVAVHPAR